jgi:hypothetical protein
MKALMIPSMSTYDQVVDGAAAPARLKRSAKGDAMRALSLSQPWATLVAIGAKKFETRSWPTTYRGPLAIHAAKGWTAEDRGLLLVEPFCSALDQARDLWGQSTPRGVIVAVCELTGCFATSREGSPWIEYPFAGLRLPPEEPEASFGDYSPGRFAFRLENVRPFDKPVPARGMLGLWEWKEEAAK